jgi:hypothetical protein
VKKNYTEAQLSASIEVILEVNTDKSKYMFISGHKTEGQSYDKSIASKSFENVLKF